MPNFGQQGPNVDDLISQSIDVSGVPDTVDVTLSFRYAYRKRSSSDYERLKVFVSNNCGDSWSQKKTLGGSQLGSEASNSNWYPTSLDDWKTVHVTNISESYYTANFRMKFSFEGDGGNNFYLDDINLYSGGPSDDLIGGITEGNQDIGLSIYPNPADSELSVDFTLKSSEILTVHVVDVLGKNIDSFQINANQGQNKLFVDTEKYAGGTYRIQVRGASVFSSLPFVKL
jgi:hypothetical protein